MGKITPLVVEAASGKGRLGRRGTAAVTIALAMVLATAGSVPAGLVPVVQDSFSGANGTQLTNWVPDVVNAPGGTYYAIDSDILSWGATINSGKANLSTDGGLGIAITNSPTFTKPQVMKISATVNLNNVTGSDLLYRGLGLGFFTAFYANDFANNFSGVVINTNGTAKLWIGGADTGQAVTYPGVWNQTADHTLEYIIDLRNGGISGALFDGQPLAFTTTGFTQAGTVFAGMGVSSQSGGGIALFDNFLLADAIPEPSTAGLLLLGGALLAGLRRR